MRGRFSSFPLAFGLSLIGLALALVAILGVRGGTEQKDTTNAAGSAAGAKAIDWKLFGRVPQRIHYLPAVSIRR